MAIRCYLAMTGAEFSCAGTLPADPAWMACHFSCYGDGLSNLPLSLPAGAMIIVNDRTPIHGHNRERILQQLLELVHTMHPACFLLDFQRPGSKETAVLTQLLTEKLPCPVGVTADYAKGLNCPVFLEPPPLHIPLKEHLAPWDNREIWLEAALEAERITVTAEGSQYAPTGDMDLSEPAFAEPTLHCRYHTEVSPARAVFHLVRQKPDLAGLLEEAEGLGVTQAVGLYQQLRDVP